MDKKYVVNSYQSITLIIFNCKIFEMKSKSLHRRNNFKYISTLFSYCIIIYIIIFFFFECPTKLFTILKYLIFQLKYFIYHYES